MNVSRTFDLGGDLPIFRMGFGAARLHGSKTWGEPKNPSAAAGILRRAVELGVNFIDTAEAYGPHASERLIASALQPYRKGLVIGTKGGMIRTLPEGAEHPLIATDGSPEALRASLEGSLQRLGLDRIDLYQLHRIDPEIGLEKSMETLEQFRAKGLIRHIGLSEVNLEEICRAQSVGPIASVQNRYSICDRTYEKEVRYCEDQGIAFIPWYPLAQGALAQGDNPLVEIAGRYGVKPGQIALSWLLTRSPVIIPIPGTTSLNHLEENVHSLDIALTERDMSALDAVATAQ